MKRLFHFFLLALVVCSCGNAPLIKRINSRHGTHIIDHAEKIGLGTTRYKVVVVK